jgi:hypothetical protein
MSRLEIAIGCVFIVENVPNGISTTGDQWPYKERQVWTQLSRTMAPCPMAYRSSTSIRIGLTDVGQPTSANCRKKPITQCINGLCNGIAFFLPHVICNTEIAMNLLKMKIISIYIIGIMDIMDKIGTTFSALVSVMNLIFQNTGPTKNFLVEQLYAVGNSSL